MTNTTLLFTLRLKKNYLFHFSLLLKKSCRTQSVELFLGKKHLIDISDHLNGRKEIPDFFEMNPRFQWKGRENILWLACSSFRFFINRRVEVRRWTGEVVIPFQVSDASSSIEVINEVIHFRFLSTGIARRWDNEPQIYPQFGRLLANPAALIVTN